MAGVAAVWVLASCGSRPALEVRTFHLRNLERRGGLDPLIEAEQKRRLHGAIGVRESEQRLGHYYTVPWSDGAAGEPVEVVLEYQQGGSGSRVKRQVREFAADRTKGTAEFTVIGDDYLKGGRVLAWKCTLLRGGREVASKQSYLWE